MLRRSEGRRESCDYGLFCLNNFRSSGISWVSLKCSSLCFIIVCVFNFCLKNSASEIGTYGSLSEKTAMKLFEWDLTLSQSIGVSIQGFAIASTSSPSSFMVCSSRCIQGAISAIPFILMFEFIVSKYLKIA